MRGLWWRGVDGSVWDLVHGPVVLAEGGLAGLMRSRTEVRTVSTANRDGRRVTGARELERYVPVPVSIVGANTPGEWEQLYRAWSRSFDPVQQGALIYLPTDVDEVLDLAARLDYAPDDYSDDHVRNRFFTGTWELVAEDPYWYLPTVSLEFASAPSTPTSYYPGYPFRRTPGRQAGRTRVDNPGTEPVNWTARFPSPSAGFELSIDGHRIAGTYPVPDGAFLEVDSARTAFYLVRGGTREALPWHLFDAVDWALLQPGTASEVQVTNQGAGVPSLTFRPKRREAL